jgi:hypothetical protein
MTTVVRNCLSLPGYSTVALGAQKESLKNRWFPDIEIPGNKTIVGSDISLNVGIRGPTSRSPP